MIKYHRWRPIRHRCIICALVVLVLGINTLPANAGLTNDIAGGPTETSTTTTAVVPVPAGLPEKQLIPAVDGIPPGSTAEALPSNLPDAGIIDPNAVNDSGDPGVLFPLAQARSHISLWMDAVETAGPATPLSDPLFEGTIFIPSNKAIEASYPQLDTEDALDVFIDVKPSLLAAQLNSLTVPGSAIRLSQLSPGQVLETADGGLLSVLSVSPEGGVAKLQQSSSRLTLSIIEANLQLGNSIAHVVDGLPPAADVAAAVTAPESAAAMEPGGRYESTMTILEDPVQELGAFAKLVVQAKLVDLLSDPDTELTLFAPSDQAVQQFLLDLSPGAQQALAGNGSLADELVSGHLVVGMALGTKALEALLPDREVQSQAGAIVLVQQQQPRSALPPPLAMNGQPVAENAAAVAAATKLTIDGAVITLPDLVGGRAVVHVINKVLVPPDVAQQLRVPTTTTAHHHISNSTLRDAQSVSSAADVLRRPTPPFQIATAALAAVFWFGRLA